MKNRLLRKTDLKSKLAATSTLDEVAAIAREYEGATELSLDALENIAGGVSADTGGHTHVWGKEEVKFGACCEANIASAERARIIFPILWSAKTCTMTFSPT